MSYDFLSLSELYEKQFGKHTLLGTGVIVKQHSKLCVSLGWHIRGNTDIFIRLLYS